MRPTNRGRTTLKRRRRDGRGMEEFDRLPAELRTWLASAALPWRPQSVKRAFAKAYARTGDRQSALRELDAMQRRLIAKDARKVWGADHPVTANETAPEQSI